MAHVWIIDDNAEMAHAVRLMVELLGHTGEVFTSAADAEQALLERTPPQIILLDLNMPTVSGDEFLQSVRRRNEFADIRIVMLTSEFAESERERLLSLGADNYLTKPIDLDDLEKALADLDTA